MARNYTPIPNEYFGEMAKLTDEQFGRLMRGCVQYNLTGKFPAMKDPEDFYRQRCINRLDRYNEEFEKTVEQRRRAGILGAQKRWHSDEFSFDNEDQTKHEFQ